MKTAHIIKRLKEDTAYQEFFKKAMAKFDIKSPADLEDPERKKNFFNYIDKNYSAKTEGKLKEASYFPVASGDEPGLRDAKKALANWFNNMKKNMSTIPTSAFDELSDLIDDYAHEYARDYMDNVDLERTTF